MGPVLARYLVQSGAEVTVSARRANAAPDGARVEVGERREALARLRRERAFDVVLDNTAYDTEAVEEALLTFPAARYVLASSTWLIRAASLLDADAPVHLGTTWPRSLNPVTVAYLDKKASAERAVVRHWAGGRDVQVVRIPMMFGLGDHTSRSTFFLERVHDGGAIFVVNGGTNHLQVAWTEDVGRLLALFAMSDIRPDGPITDLLPLTTISARDFIEMTSILATGRPVDLVPVASAHLGATFPAYLQKEPLWQERSCEPSSGNLYRMLNEVPSPPRTMLTNLIDGSPHGLLRARMPALRTQELQILATMKRESGWAASSGQLPPKSDE
jgi:nucleoside-diphosphate-sugar epimerase